MLTEAIMHDCVVKLLKHHDEESLECLCRLLTTIGKDLDFEKAKVRRGGDVFFSCGIQDFPFAWGCLMVLRCSKLHLKTEMGKHFRRLSLKHDKFHL